MAQSGYTPIVLFHSNTSGNQPTTSNLQAGELALNIPDGKIYYNTGSGIAVLIGTSGYSGFSGYSGIGFSGGSGFSGYSGYSGFSGASATLNTVDFTATSGQTTFSVTYSPTLLQGVYRNGVKLGLTDYTATNGTSIVLATGAITGDLIEVQYFSNAAVTGTSGYSGYSGYSGVTGTNGTSGFSGYSGTNGTNGTNGTSGFSGYSGSGVSGYSGFSGYSGSAATASIPSGSVLLFYQSAAPTGWTQVTTLNDYDLRLVSGTGGSTGGTTAYSSVFTNQTPSINVSGLSAAATTLSTAQIASHAHGYLASGGFCPCPPGGAIQTTYGSSSGVTNSAGGGGSHTHSISCSASSSTITLNVRYANVIICSKN